MASQKLKILLFGNPVLREIAKPVTVFHKKLNETIDAMIETLNDREDGAALAANQVGILKRIVVVNYKNELFEMINPEIITMEGSVIDSEGCLSLPGFAGNVPRAERVVVKYQTRNGSEYIAERNGFLARCFQHEIDHLNGILYTDRMEEKFLTYLPNGEKILIADLFKAILNKN